MPARRRPNVRLERWRTRINRSRAATALLDGLIIALVTAAGLRISRALPYIEHDIPMLALERALIGALPLAATWVFMRFFASRAAERYDRRRLVVATVAILSAVQALQGFATAVSVLIVLSALAGVQAAEAWLAGLDGDATPEDLKGSRRSALQNAAFTGFLGLFDAGAPLLMEHYGWRWAFWAPAAIGLPVAVAAMLLLPSEPTSRRPVRPAGASTGPDRAAVLERRIALFNGLGYGAMVGPLALVLAGHGGLAWLWLFGLRRVVPVATNLAWEHVAATGPAAHRVFRPTAPLVASTSMIAPFGLWAGVLLGAPREILLGLGVAWVCVEITRGAAWTTLRTLPAPAAFNSIVSATVLGIALGGFLGILSYSLVGHGAIGHAPHADLAVIALGTAFWCAELPAALERGRLLSFRDTGERGAFRNGDTVTLGHHAGADVLVGGAARPFDHRKVVLEDAAGHAMVEIEDRGEQPLRGALRSAERGQGDLFGPRSSWRHPTTTWVPYANRWALVRVHARVVASVNGTTVAVTGTSHRRGQVERWRLEAHREEVNTSQHGS